MSKKSPINEQTLLETDPAALTAAVKKAVEALEEVRSHLPALSQLTIEERVSSVGKLREGEPQAMLAILATVDNHPEYFRSLAGKDHGIDLKKTETDPTRHALTNAEALKPLANAVQALSSELDDSVLDLSAIAREFTIAAYRIARPVAEADPDVRKSLAPAINFYGAPSRKQSRKEPDPTT